jgi:hypothetical protein
VFAAQIVDDVIAKFFIRDNANDMDANNLLSSNSDDDDEEIEENEVNSDDEDERNVSSFSKFADSFIFTRPAQFRRANISFKNIQIVHT